MGFAELNLQSILFLAFVFVIFVFYRLVFRDRISWQRIFHGSGSQDNIDSVKKLADRYSEKFRTSSLFKATLKVLQLEEHEVTHFNNIGDNFENFSDLSNAIKEAGLESSNIIIGVDFTASNEWQGRSSFDRKSLHTISTKGKRNPYQQVIATLSTTLEPFDDDKLIPAFGFGDIITKDKTVFSFRKNEEPCKGFHHVLECYEEIVKAVELSGPTSYVPMIEKAIAITKERKYSYHILLIIADGQVEDSEDEQTREIIIKASYYPISIIVVGVGDGPWDNMKAYDEKLPSRLFDNFQFVDYHECLQKSQKASELTFALHALMEIPDQYKKIKELGLLTTDSKKPTRETSLLEQELNQILIGNYDAVKKENTIDGLQKRKISTFFNKRNSQS